MFHHQQTPICQSEDPADLGSRIFHHFDRWPSVVTRASISNQNDDFIARNSRNQQSISGFYFLSDSGLIQEKDGSLSCPH
jgi:hypothetical protein